MAKFNSSSNNSRKGNGASDKSSNRNSKGNRRGNNNRKGKDKPVETEEVRSRDARSMNDITWYAANPTLLENSSQLPYSWMTGLVNEQARSYSLSESYVVPGILAAHVTLNPLSLNNASDPVNVASRLIVGNIRAANSGAKNYDAPDLMLRLLAEGNFIAFLNFVIRAYATVRMYSAYNKYMPRDLLIQQGFDPDDLRQHINDFLGEINNVITEASSILYIPPNLPLYKRWAWLFSNYYCDSNNPKDQIYMLIPNGYSVFDLDPDTKAGRLEFVEWNPGVTHTWEDAIAALRDMLRPLIEDSELCTMTGDMKKYFGEQTSLPLALIPTDIMAVPVHDPVVLQQFKCSRAMMDERLGITNEWRNLGQGKKGDVLTRPNDFTVPTQLDVQVYDIETPETLISVSDDIDNIGTEMYQFYCADTILESPNPVPTLVDNMENSRLIWMPDNNAEVEDNVIPIESWTAGSEVVEYYTLGIRKYTREYNEYEFEFTTFKNVIGALHLPAGYRVSAIWFWRDVQDVESLLAFLQTFDYAPTVYVAHAEAVPEEGLSWSMQQLDYPMTPHLRICNFAYLPYTMAKKMNNCALLSELGVAGFQPK